MVLDTEMHTLVMALKSTNSYEEIAQILHCDVESVASCVKECELNGGKATTLKLKLPSISIRREVGRPKVFENRRLIENMLHEHPNYTSIDVQRELMVQHGIEVSRRTLQRRISEIRSKQFPLKVGGLSAEVRKRRLDWAEAHQDWTVRDWRNIFNMDDLKFVNGTPPKEIFLDTLVGPEGTDCQDLNLLELLMDIIGPKIQTQAPKTVYEFRAVLYDVWHSDHEMVDKIEQLYESMSWRVSAVIQNGGNETEFC